VGPPKPKPVTDYDQSGAKLNFFERRRMRRWQRAVEENDRIREAYREELRQRGVDLVGYLPHTFVGDTHLGMEATPAFEFTRDELMAGHFGDIAEGQGQLYTPIRDTGTWLHHSAPLSDPRQRARRAHEILRQNLQHTWTTREANTVSGEVVEEMLMTGDVVGDMRFTREEYESGVERCRACGCELDPAQMYKRHVSAGTMDPVATSMRTGSGETSYISDYTSKGVKLCHHCWRELCANIQYVVERKLEGQMAVARNEDAYSGSLGRERGALLW